MCSWLFEAALTMCPVDAVQDKRGAVEMQQLDAGQHLQGPDQDLRPHASSAQ